MQRVKDRPPPHPPQNQRTPCSGRTRFPYPRSPLTCCRGRGSPGPASAGWRRTRSARPGPPEPWAPPWRPARPRGPRFPSGARPRPHARRQRQPRAGLPLPAPAAAALGAAAPGAQRDQRWRHHGREEQGARTLHGCVRSPSELPRCWQ